MKMYQTNQADIPAADHVPAADQGSTPEAEVDIEAEINQELADIRKPAGRPLFTSVKLDTQCCMSTCLRCFTFADPSISNILPNTFACGTRILHRKDLS